MHKQKHWSESSKYCLDLIDWQIYHLSNTTIIISRLSSQRLILSEDYRKGLETKLRLNVGFDDINFALNNRVADPVAS